MHTQCHRASRRGVACTADGMQLVGDLGSESLLLDIKVMFMTIPKVLGSKDIAQEGHVTMKPFEGKKE